LAWASVTALLSTAGILDAQDWADLESLYAQAKKAETESRDNKECQQQLL
jgi:hypothetical protein